MYKIIIIDDEPIIVKGLSKTIPWETYNCQVVGTASNGKEGVELIKNQKPDIIISDINMPGMDGLTMIASIKSQFPKTQICILTGYRDFDYARRAICLGVTRYLLKPSKMNELLDALQVMTANLADSATEIQKDIPAAEDTPVSKESSILKDTSTLKDTARTSSSESKPEENTASSFIVKNALQYIDENYQQKIMLSEVAENIYVSQWHLSKLLHRHTGQNFSEILNNVRINKAKELLDNPTLRIGDIAEEVGFVDIAHFSKVFKKIVGISANEYRNTVLSK